MMCEDCGHATGSAFCKAAKLRTELRARGLGRCLAYSALKRVGVVPEWHPTRVGQDDYTYVQAWIQEDCGAAVDGLSVARRGMVKAEDAPLLRRIATNPEDARVFMAALRLGAPVGSLSEMFK